MNQIFSITRFGRLLRKYFSDNGGQLLANVGLLAGGLFVLGLFAYQGAPGSVTDSRLILFFLLGWPCWYVFTVQQTAILNQKERAINYFMQPASQFEKVTLIWLISGLGFIIVYVASFSVLDRIGVTFVNNRDWTPEQLAMIRRQGGMFEIKSFFNSKNGVSIPQSLWVFTAILHAFTLAFSLLIRRYTLPLVVVIGFALVIIVGLVNGYLLHSLTGNITIRALFPFQNITVESPTNHGWRKVDVPQPVGSQIRYATGILAVVLLYITAYFRLKEREV